MQPRSILAVLAIAAFVMAAEANHYTWVGGAENHLTDWSWAANWTTGGIGTYPKNSGDTATIGNQANDPELTEHITVGSVTIQNGGELTTNQYALTITDSAGLDIQSGGKLVVNRVDSTSGKVVLSGGGTHYISGTGELRLSDTACELSITSNDATISYSGTAGKIEGQHNDAQITVAAEEDPGISLTSNIVIEGAMQIAGLSEVDKVTGTFVNNGLVHANRTTGDRVLQLVSGTIDDSAGDRWTVDTDSSAVLKFSVSATGLEGNFVIDDGATLAIHADVTTTGSFTCTSGWVDIENEATFTYLSGQLGETAVTSDCECGSCP